MVEAVIPVSVRAHTGLRNPRKHGIAEATEEAYGGRPMTELTVNKRIDAPKRFARFVAGVIEPGRPAPDPARGVMNLDVDLHPGLIARCGTTDEVPAAVEHAAAERGWRTAEILSLEPAAMRSVEAATGEPRRLDVAALPEHFERLYRAAYGLCRRREDAEDLVQETYARVLRRPRLLRREDDLAYLLRVLRNTWISEYRAAAARPVASDLAEVELIADPHGDPTVAAVELTAIYEAIQDLPDALRETVVAVDVVGLSYRQAARALRTKQGTIMSRLYRARERIVSQLDARSR